MSIKKYHYVYKLTHIETNEFYYGSRSTKFHPSLDSYMGSMVTWKPDKTKLVKEIIKDDFKTREDANIFESNLIYENINNALNKNYNHGGGIFCTLGTIAVKDENGNIFRVSVNDPRYLNNELVAVSKGMVTVKNINGDYSQVSLDDPKYLSGELVASTVGMFPAKDKNGNISWVSINDPRYLSGELVGLSKGRNISEDHKRKIGEANSKLQSGTGNSQYGKCWITNGKESKKIYRGDLIPEGWKLGRVVHSDKTKKLLSDISKKQTGEKNSCHNTIWIFNPKINKRKRIKKEKLSEYESMGFKIGLK